ncbi:UDP-N-acetylglucosamine 4,6-dehydratase family protein [Chloroflexota bacterium]
MLRGKKVLITGGTGSIGSSIVRKVLEYAPEVVRIFSNDEDAQFALQQELQSHENVRFLIGDIRDKERLARAIEAIDIVFHAAALKHVPLCEYNPFEAVKTNVLGTQNLIEAALDEEVDKVITISTDKAVNPINVMGATKLLAERLTIAVNYYKGLRETAFSCVRFGNVLDSRGSVVPLFRAQIEKGGPLTITDFNMTRFVTSIPKAVEIIIQAAQKAQGGETFIIKMPVLRVGDLAEVMIEELAPKYGYDPKKIKVKIVGKRPGEKNHEYLMTEEEMLNAYETEDMFVVLPQISDIVKPEGAKVSYDPKKSRLLTKDEIRELCRQEGLV